MRTLAVASAVSLLALAAPFVSPLVGAAVAAESRAAEGGAASAADAERRAAVIAKVGGRSITAGELEDRLAAIPAFQLASFGTTPEAIRRKFLNDVLVTDALYVAGAEAKKLGETLPTSQQLRRALSNATLRATREKVGLAANISPADVRAYYEANRSRYEQPERYGVWRILCKTRDEAVTVLAAARKEPTPQVFVALAREHSIDKATNLRGGNLGFLSLDGASNEAGLRLDPSVVKAATTVRDGELVPGPVPEGDAFAVVWRRGTVGASRRPLEDATAQIRDTLFRQRLELSQKEQLQELRAKNLKELNDALINTIEIAPENGSVVPRKRPGQVPPLGAPSAAGH